jgi:hypothetical protein
MRDFYLAYPDLGQPLAPDILSPKIFQTLSGKFPRPWSHYVKLHLVKSIEAQSFYGVGINSEADRPVGKVFHAETVHPTFNLKTPLDMQL